MVSWNYRFQPLRAVTDYLPTWIENQSRIPNDRCAFENNIWPVRKKRLNELIETNACKTKIYGFVQITEDKEVKLLFTICHFVIIYWCGRQIDVPEAVIGCILKKTLKKNKAVRKAVVNFFPPTNAFISQRLDERLQPTSSSLFI